MSESLSANMIVDEVLRGVAVAAVFPRCSQCRVFCRKGTC